MRRPKPGTYEAFRQRERERGMRGKADKCRRCDVDLKRFEMEEGLCSKCLRENSTHVRTEARV